MNQPSGLAAMALAAVLLSAGCLPFQTEDVWVPASPGDQQGDVTLYRDVHFDDIPVPPEYQLLADQSFSFQGSQFRTAVFHYAGPLEWTRALAFYRSQMPLMGWTLDSTERGFSDRVFRFVKGPEQALVTVRQVRAGSRTEIQVDKIQSNDLLLKGLLPSD